MSSSSLSTPHQNILADSDKSALICLSQVPGLGPQRIQQLVQVFEAPSIAWQSDSSAWQEHHLSLKLYAKMEKFRNTFELTNYLAFVDSHQQTIITNRDTNYPQVLIHQVGAPPILYCKVTETLHANPDYSLSVVGTRKITAYGQTAMHRLLPEVINQGVAIISGLMYGVDEAAHRIALKHNGLTIGVWAGGLDTLEIGSRQPLAQAILDSGGVLISEYPPGFKPSPQTFPARNRIVAGLSQATLAVEGTEKSGTLITAGYAAELGKEVLAIPGSITSPQSATPHLLIKNGATLVQDSSDIFVALGLNTTSHLTTLDLTSLSEIQQQIITTLQTQPQSTDQLVTSVNLPISQLSLELTSLELQSLIIKVGETWQIQ